MAGKTTSGGKKIVGGGGKGGEEKKRIRTSEKAGLVVSLLRKSSSLSIWERRDGRDGRLGGERVNEKLTLDVFISLPSSYYSSPLEGSSDISRRGGSRKGLVWERRFTWLLCE